MHAGFWLLHYSKNRSVNRTMIIEKLKERKDFTPVESNLAAFLLDNGLEIRHMSITDLAEATYTSPAAITRFCRKLGVEGFKNFRVSFHQEFESYMHEKQVDENLPFERGDSFEMIVRKMGVMNEASIRRVISDFNYDQLKRIAYQLERADVINIFGIGTSSIVALDFETKLVRFGKQVNVNTNSVFLPGYALNSSEKSFNLMISQSGTKRRILECAQILRRKGRYVVSITTNTEGVLASLSNEVISVKTGENESFSQKMESFSPFYATHFVLDCLYCFLFRLNFDRNVSESRRRAELLHDAETEIFSD